MAQSQSNKPFWNIILIISGVSLVLKLAASGNITIQQSVILLLLILIGAALNSNAVKAVLSFAGLGYFLLDYVHYDMDKFYQLSGSVLALILVLLGLYTMIKGLFNK